MSEKYTNEEAANILRIGTSIVIASYKKFSLYLQKNLSKFGDNESKIIEDFIEEIKLTVETIDTQLFYKIIQLNDGDYPYLLEKEKMEKIHKDILNEKNI